MRVLATFPGKFGDLLWALPTIRALSRRIGASVDFMIAAPYMSIVPLLEVQPYLGKVWADRLWETQDTAPISPRLPPRTPIGIMSDLQQPAEETYTYDLTLHLGYREWPLPNLARHTFETLRYESARQGYGRDIVQHPEELDLTTPWIASPLPHYWDFPWVHGFTDEHFELKYGIVSLMASQKWGVPRGGMLPCRVGSDARWNTEAGETPNTWVETAELLQGAKVFLGCCSALHVLAVAMGVPVVLVEPNPMRHNQVFYPVGTEGPQVYLVRGNDGHPTFDARHVNDVLQNVLAGVRAKGVDSSIPR